jgi:outer membrane protein TolC
MRALASGLLPNPEIEAGTKRAREEGTGPTFGIKQELPINGALGLERQAADFGYSASRADLQREIQIALGEARTAYIEALSTRELKGIEEHGMQVASESLRLVSETLKAGLSSTLPYLLAQTEYANAKKSRQIADSNHRVARTRLARLLAMDESALPPLSGNLKETLVPPGSNLPIHSRPDLQASSLRVQSAQSSAASADRERIPNPVLGFTREETDESAENFFTIGLRVPLFNTGRPKVNQRLAEVQTASAERNALANTVQAEQEQGEVRLTAAAAAVQVYESEILPSVQRSLEAAGIAFQSGTTDLSLLLQTQSRLIEQERGYIRALEDLRKAESEYLLAHGTPAKR